jgi:hypothetical protein
MTSHHILYDITSHSVWRHTTIRMTQDTINNIDEYCESKHYVSYVSFLYYMFTNNFVLFIWMHYNLRVTSWVLFEEIISLGLHKDVLNPHCEMITTCMFTYVLDLKSLKNQKP